MPERFNLGQLLVIVGAAALLVSLFLDWYEPGLSAWEIFEIGDLVVAGLAIVALVSALPMRLPEGAATLAAARSLPWIGLAALLFVVVTLLNNPPAARDLPLEFGAWLGLIGAALMAIGGFLSMSRISIVVSSRPSAAGTPRAPTPAERGKRDAATATRPIDDEPPHEP